MATFKELFWPHEYTTPVHAVKYRLNRCTDSHCWGKVVAVEPYPACAKHATHDWLDALRASYAGDPLFRLQVETEVTKYTPPPHSIWWRISMLWRKGRR